MKGSPGFLMIDHRASPGLPEDLARANGLDPKLVGEGKLFEADTMTCAHCKCSTVKNPLRVRPRETCRKCSNHYVCDVCAFAMTLPDYNHLPYEKIRDLVSSEKPMAQGSPPKLILPPT